MPFHRIALILSGAFAVAVISFGSTIARGPALIAHLEEQAAVARDKADGHEIRMRFSTPQGWLTRHPELSGGTRLNGAVRAHAASAVAAVPGIGGVHWRASGKPGQALPEDHPVPGALHCQRDVESILKVRTIRFSEASALIDPASEKLLNEVASALQPCVGSIIAVTGHTDSAGDEGANLALSRARADAVRWALIGRGIPADGLRATGKGSSKPLAGLDPKDPANRRIEFSVIATMPLQPTPVDTPGPG